MINNRQQSGRRRGRGGQRPQGSPGRPEQGNRIDNRARGNASQLLEKYKTLARDAQTQGDRVMTEYYLQFADHYFRVLSESRARFEENRRPRDEYQDDEDDGDDIRADSVSDIDFGDRDRVDQDRGEPRRERPRRDDREPREAREPREQRDTREVREPREAREPREQRDTREVREPRETREPREQRETREPREPREQRETREPRAPREAREPRERRPRQEPVQAELAIEEQPVEVREERVEARPSRGLRPRRNGTTNGHDRSEGDVGIDADRLPPSFGIRVEESASAPETAEAEPEAAPKPRRGRPRKVVEAPAAEG